jgi:O-methyltransferase involved in polyketide biosynthesis
LPRAKDDAAVARTKTVADTAFSIAAVRAAEEGRPPRERLFDDPYARHFLAAGAHAAENTQRFLDLPFFRSDEVWRMYLTGEPHPNAWIAKVGLAIV